MECSILSLMTMLVGIVFLLLTNKTNKLKIFTIFILTSLGMLTLKAFFSLTLGTWDKVAMNYYYLFQQFQFYIDPFSAFIEMLIIIILFLSLYKIFTDKNLKKESYCAEIILLTIFGLVALISTQNIIYFETAFIILNIILLFVNSFNSNTNKMKMNMLFVFLCFSLISLMITLLVIYGQSSNFTDLINPLIKYKDFSNTIFAMLFLASGLPFLFNENILSEHNNFQKFNQFEIVTLKSLFSLLYFACLFKFTVMGAIPYPLWNIYIISIIAVFGIVKLYKMFRSANIKSVYSNMKTTQLILVILSFFIGINGFIHKIPLLTILGFIATFIIYVNVIFHTYFFEPDTENENENKHLFELYSYIGMPLTLGFWGWCFLFSALYVGAISSDLQLKICSYIIALFALITIISFITKNFIVLKKCLTDKNEIELKLIKPDLLLNIIIILIGICPKIMLKLIFVPVSLFTGGTKFHEIFDAILVLSGNVNVYILYFSSLIVLYILIKLLILRKLKNSTKV